MLLAHIRQEGAKTDKAGQGLAEGIGTKFGEMRIEVAKLRAELETLKRELETVRGMRVVGGKAA